MSRLSGYKAKKAREFCLNRDGAVCRMASDGYPCKGDLVLDHVDGNPENNPETGENWQLLCRAHNGRKASRGRGATLKFASFKRLEHSLVKSTEGEKAQRRELYGIRGISAEMLKSEEIRPKIEGWILETVKREGKLELSEAINSGAYLGKCNQGTVKRYVDALTSKVGPLCIESIENVEYLVMKKQ
jgi:hypothetical protein